MDVKEEEEAECEVSFVDRGEEFVGVEEVKRATLVLPASLRSSRQSNPPAPGVTAHTETLTIHTASAWDSAHNVTHSSVVTSSGYDSSPPTDVSFSSPFQSPEQDFPPVFSGEGAPGVSLGWGEDLPSLPDFGSQREWSRYFQAGQSGVEEGWQEMAGTSVDPAATYSSMSASSAVMSDRAFTAGSAVPRGLEEGRESGKGLREQSGSDANLEESEDGEVSSEQEVSVHDGDYHREELSSLVGATGMAGPVRGADAAHTSVDSPKTGGESATNQDPDEGIFSPGVSVDRGERFIPPEDLPKSTSIATLPTKLSTYSTSVNMSQDSPGSSSSPGHTDDSTVAPKTRPVISVYTDFAKTTDRNSQSVADQRAERAVTVDDVLSQCPGEELSTGGDVPGSRPAVTDTEQKVNKDSTDFTEDAGEVFRSQSPQTVSKVKYSVHFKTSGAPQDKERTPSGSDTRDRLNSGQERFTSTLVIAAGEARNAETTAVGKDYSAGNVHNTDRFLLGLYRHSATSYFTKPCSATFDVGRLRSPTPVRLTGGHWGQVSQIITPQLTNSVCVSVVQPESHLVTERRGESVTSVETQGVQTEDCRKAEIGVDTAGGEQTTGVVWETGRTGEEGEERGLDASSVVSSSNITQPATSHHSNRLFSPADEEPGKLCYFSHVADDDEAEDDDDDGRAVSCLDIFVHDYTKHSDFTEHRSLFQCDSTAEEEESESLRSLSKRESSTALIEECQEEAVVVTGPDSEGETHTDDKDHVQQSDLVEKTEPARHSQHLTVLFDYSGNVEYLEDYTEHHGFLHEITAPDTVKHGVVEFYVKSTPSRTVISMSDQQGGQDTEQTREDWDMASGQSAVLMSETEAIRDESPSVTTTINGGQVSQLPAHLEDSPAQLCHLGDQGHVDHDGHEEPGEDKEEDEEKEALEEEDEDQFEMHDLFEDIDTNSTPVEVKKEEEDDDEDQFEMHDLFEDIDTSGTPVEVKKEEADDDEDQFEMHDLFEDTDTSGTPVEVKKEEEDDDEDQFEMHDLFEDIDTSSTPAEVKKEEEDDDEDQFEMHDLFEDIDTSSTPVEVKKEEEDDDEDQFEMHDLFEDVDTSSTPVEVKKEEEDDDEDQFEMHDLFEDIDTPEDTQRDVSSGQQTDMAVKEMVAAGGTTIQAGSSTDTTDFSSLTSSAIMTDCGTKDMDVNLRYQADWSEHEAASVVTDSLTTEETTQTTNVESATIGVPSMPDDDFGYGNSKDSDGDLDEEDDDEEDYNNANEENDSEDIMDENANDEFKVILSSDERGTTSQDDAQLLSDDVSNSDVVTETSEISSEDQVTREYSDADDEAEGGSAVGDDTDNDVEKQVLSDQRDSVISNAQTFLKMFPQGRT
ncbi:uncharacterized protein LOC143281297 [Babylonia areolata]|uniref:uncharacterized protein LOC143281297 n=1 Tax=Babylonia areolata TaxID=304850 RepID=UPI003FD364EA